MMPLFHRLIVEDWQNSATADALLVFFVVFVAIIIRVLFISKKESDHMAHLPLENESSHPITKHGKR